MNQRDNTQPGNPGNPDHLNGVAIIGMAGRFPKARNIDEFWNNLENKVECITFYDDRQLLDAGLAPEVLKNPDYVKAKGEVAEVDRFDASFFGINPREAEVTDPQHRMLLECAWEAMEHAGCDPGKFDGPIGLFAGKSMDYYLLLNVFPRIKKELSAGSLQAAIGNDKDSLTTTIAYRLNLTGPVITVQTSSSTSLVSVCVACQSLLTYQCDVALAGGITAGPPIRSGYLYQEGNIWSPDGHTRAFDAKAKGFVSGSGMGLVVLKRLEDARRDGDTIWAVIKGFAVNNDGYNKISYSAPSVDAQAAVVAEALAVADVHPETIQYIETHGTGTNLGDPIEITALDQAFHAYTNQKHFCAIGSVKTNIGHLDTAAGVAGLIKVALSLKHKKIPASLHFETPNPKIDWENSPFFVNTELKDWKPNFDPQGTPIPRRAGVTSLGMGGTNAHVILEEAPESQPTGESRDWQLLLLSAKTNTALEKITQNLRDYFKAVPARAGDLEKNRRHVDPLDPDLVLADAAYTLKVGRRDFNNRRMVLCRGIEDAKTVLENMTPGRVVDTVCEIVERPVVFMFPGQGSQYVNMGKELYQTEPVFKENLDKCAAYLEPLLGIDPLEILYPGLRTPMPAEPSAQKSIEEKNAEQLRQTWLTQPVLFMVEYALARLWMEWGIVPVGMIGHSIGEFVAACISGSIGLEDAIKAVALRGRLMHKQEPGAMLSIGIDEAGLKDMLTDGLSLAAVNSPKHGVVSGGTQAVAQLEKHLEHLAEKNIFCKPLHTSHAFHSAMMDPLLDEFTAAMEKIKGNPPTIPFISGVTGTWISAEEAAQPRYWARQLRETVRFSDGITEILKDPNRILLEVGPGNSLSILAKEHKITVDKKESVPTTFSTLRHFKQTGSDLAFLQKTLGHLWLSGVTMDWKKYYKNEKRRRIPLPTYPFEKKRYWVEEVKEKKTGVELGIEKEEAPTGDTANIPGTGAAKAETEIKPAFQPRPQLSSEYVPPTDEIEQQLVEMWEDILGIKPIGIKDNFFDLGGHSLLATLFLSQLLEKFQVRIELRNIFESPSIDIIAGLVKIEKSKAVKLEDVENILSEIEGLSPEEIKEAAAKENP